MAKRSQRGGAATSAGKGPGLDVLLDIPGLVPEYVLAPVDLAKPLSDAQRAERFDDRLRDLESDERMTRSTLESMQAHAEAERWRLARAPRRWHRARARASDWQRGVSSERKTQAALRRQLRDLRDLIERGGALAQRAAMLAYELAEWRAERELGEDARAHVAETKRRSEQGKRPGKQRERQREEHERWRTLAKRCRLKGANERARWVAKQAGCPDRWRTVRDFLRREREEAEREEAEREEANE